MIRTGSPLADSSVADAVAASRLGELPRTTLARVLADATRVRIPACASLRHAGDVGSHVELVVSGLLRIAVSSPDGRTLTVRYCPRGSLLGVASLFTPPYAMPGPIQALVDSEVLLLRPSVISAAAADEPAVLRALAEELADRTLAFANEIPRSAFGSVRQRVARHLLDVASELQDGPQLIAPIDQQALADAVGTAREVVVRVLRELRAEGLVETRRRGIVLVAPERLFEEAEPNGTWVPSGTTTGR